MLHSLTDDCPVCRALCNYQGILQGYIKNRCARIFSPQISAILFQVQAHLKACTGQCAWTLAALDFHYEISTLLSGIWEHLNDHKLFLEWMMRPTKRLANSGINLHAMRDYLDSHGLMPLRDKEATPEEFTAALDRYLNLCEKEGLYHIVDRWISMIAPEAVLEPPF